MGQVNRPGSLLDQITALRREIATVRRSSGVGGGAISDGSLTIQRGGSLRMVDADGTELVYLGPGPDGRQIVRFRRQGGGDVLATYTTADGRPGWALSANSGEPMVADDPITGDVLARPWMPVPMAPVRPQDLPAVAGGEFETVVEARFTKTHAVVELSTLDTAEAGTGGEGRIVITDATGRVEVVDTWTVGTEFADRRRGPFPLPGRPYTGTVSVTVQWRRTTGRGQIRGTALGLIQRESPLYQLKRELSTPSSTTPGRR